jgi:hypothetical protein
VVPSQEPSVSPNGTPSGSPSELPSSVSSQVPGEVPSATQYPSAALSLLPASSRVRDQPPRVK